MFTRMIIHVALICSLLGINLSAHTALAEESTASAANNYVTLKVIEQFIVVNDKKKKVYNIIQPDGSEGIKAKKGQFFNILLKNETPKDISIHWHGLILPNNQDGVPYVTQLPLKPGEIRPYHFKLIQSGTYWMHSHLSLDEQDLMTAPLIITDPTTPSPADKEVVLMFQDFTFKNPEEVLAELKKPKMNDMKNTPMTMDSKPDISDVKYDAFLTNRRTLQNPEIVMVNPGQKIRLRLINGAAATNFWVDTGQLKGTIIAADGADTKPLASTLFQIAIGQRLDVIVTIPEAGGVFPILGKPEGTNQQTGLLLATPSATIPQLSETASVTMPALNNGQEMKLHAMHPLPPKPVTRTLNYQLGGNMQNYVWTLNHEIWPLIKPLTISQGDRVELVFTNNTGMAHPMHYHGHVFQVTEINGKPLANGPLRDSILVLPHQTVKVQYDADNPGIWIMHCHVLYHLITGMATTINYKNYPQPSYYKNLLQGKIKE
ncbi:multicopper oxidase family protein [Legionella nagasakiensis]|uniref:multicopper oxidase family protein n=1 Tax=Legionella nagasakiensis TaxID=535290 RepID=UPI001056C85F|nr:multicopper oxidase family protein [Legionella nagasakiensis]